MGYKIAQGEWVDFSVAQIPPGDLATGYVIYLLGSLAVHIGLNYMRPLENNERGGPADRSSVSFAGIAALWTLGVMYLFRASWFSSLGNASRPLGWMALSALSLFVLVPRERMGISKSAFGVILFIATTGLLFANIRSGSKAFVMYSFIPLIWMLLVRRDLRRGDCRLESGCYCFTSASLLPRWTNLVRYNSKKARALSLISFLRFSRPGRESAPMGLNDLRNN